MKLLDYLTPKTYPAPPVVEPGRHGNITRFDPARVPKPIDEKQNAKPSQFANKRGRPGKESLVLEAIKAGHWTYSGIQAEVQIRRQCLIGHVQNLEAEGLITVDRKFSPYRISFAGSEE